MIHRFSAARVSWNRSRTRVFVRAQHDSDLLTLKPEEFALAELFDGRRDDSDVFRFYEQSLHPLLAADARTSLIRRLISAGVLQQLCDASDPIGQDPDGRKPEAPKSPPKSELETSDTVSSAASPLTLEHSPESPVASPASQSRAPAEQPEADLIPKARQDKIRRSLLARRMLTEVGGSEKSTAPDASPSSATSQAESENSLVQPPLAPHKPFSGDESGSTGRARFSLDQAFAVFDGDEPNSEMRKFPPRDGAGRRTASSGRTAARQRERKQPRLWQWDLTPFSGLCRALAAPLWSSAACWLLLALACMAGFGLWFNRDEVSLAVWDTANLWFLLQRLLLILLLINLGGALIRAGAIMRASGRIPVFGLRIRFALIHLVPWPQFHTDLSLIRATERREDRYRIVAAPILFNLLLFVIASFTWISVRHGVTELPRYTMELLLLSGVFLLLGLNPLTRSNFYHLVSMKLRIRNLRGEAFKALVGMDNVANTSAARWLLRAYALSVIAFLGALLWFMFAYVGSYLVSHFGGLGALYFGGALTLLLVPALVKLWGAWSRGKVGAGARAGARVVSPTPVERERGWRLKVLFLLIFAVVCVLPYQYETAGDFELLPLGRAEVHSQIEGEVREVLVREGEEVESGQVVARIYNDTQIRDLEQSQATIIKLQAQLQKGLAGPTPEEIALARQSVRTAQTRLDFSDRQVERNRPLVDKGFISPQTFENQLSQSAVDAENLAYAQRALEELLAGTRAEDIRTLEAELLHEQARLRYAEARLAQTEIRAPIAGRVVSESLMHAVGDYLEVGNVLMTIENSDTLIVQIRVPESDIALVPAKADVRLRAWAKPDFSFTGRIHHISPAAEDAEIGRTVRVLMELDNRELRFPSGLTGYAKISCEEMMVIQAFTRMLVRLLWVEVWAWIP